jgi:hypothetical protein
MTPSARWEQWDGEDFPATRLNSVVYYYPGKVDIEEHDHINDLITEVHQDGVTPSKLAARALLEKAVVVHGLVQQELGELTFYTGDEAYGRGVFEATWVELDEYSD